MKDACAHEADHPRDSGLWPNVTRETSGAEQLHDLLETGQQGYVGHEPAVPDGSRAYGGGTAVPLADRGHGPGNPASSFRSPRISVRPRQDAGCRRGG